jgi:hypothetical protein
MSFLARGPSRFAVVVVTVLAGSLAWSGTGAAEPTMRLVAMKPQATASPDIVGRWMQVHTCDQLVDGLEEQGLGAIAPSVVGDYFPDLSPEQLAAKDDICSGARPQRHFHFFAASGAFGSLDQHEQQVDDGTWELVDAQTLRINDGTFRFEVSGDRLTLTPLITDEQKADALADPLVFSTAGWMVAVSYPGMTWRRVPCLGWC